MPDGPHQAIKAALTRTSRLSPEHMTVMNAFDESKVHRDVGGRFDEKEHSAPELTLNVQRDLSAETPVAIDTAAADLYYQEGALRTQQDRHQQYIDDYNRLMERARRADGSLPYQESRYPERVAELQEKVDALETRIQELRAEAQPYEDEFTRRGGWPRAFLVTGGHLHSSMYCSTCNREGKPTRFAWMTEYSGSDEEQIVEAAGNRACTTCYPSAPVEALGRESVMLTPEEQESNRQREEREAEKRRREAEKAAKAITQPDGTELRTPGRYGQPVRTLVTAERELTDALMWVNHYTHTNQEARNEQAAWADTLVTAIAHKKGISEDEARASGEKKAAAKYKRR